MMSLRRGQTGSPTTTHPRRAFWGMFILALTLQFPASGFCGQEARKSGNATTHTSTMGTLTSSQVQVMVTGHNAELDVPGQLTVGNNGPGSLTISSGGKVTDQNGVVGGNAGSKGTAQVSGAGSEWDNSRGLEVGVTGPGTLAVTNGGWVTAGTPSQPGAIEIGSHGAVNASGGTLQGNVVVDAGGTLDPASVTMIVGNLNEASGGDTILEVTGPGEYGQIDITGDASFDGTFDINFAGPNSYAGETFDFINVGFGGLPGTLNFGPDFVLHVTGLGPGAYSDSFNAGTGAWTLTVNPTPEPGSVILLMISLLGLAGLTMPLRRNMAPALNA